MHHQCSGERDVDESETTTLDCAVVDCVVVDSADWPVAQLYHSSQRDRLVDCVLVGSIVPATSDCVPAVRRAAKHRIIPAN